MQVCNRENPEIRVCKAHRPLEENDHFRKTEKLFKYFKPHRMGKRKIIPNETDFSTCIHPLTTPSEFIESKPGVFHHKELNDSLNPVRSRKLGYYRLIKIAFFKYSRQIDKIHTLYIIPNFLSLDEKVDLIKKSLHSYPLPPAPTNVRQLIENNHPDIKTDSDTPLCPGGERIRWANLGYRYDWTCRKYYDQEPTIKLPDEITTLSHSVVERCGLPTDNFSPDSCLVNYYKTDTQFMGHIDDAEEQAEKNPLVSLSIGLSAVFLHAFGDSCQDRTRTPAAFLLKSGDAMVMYGPSRLCLHGVPRVIENTCPEDLLEKLTGTPEADYIKSHRSLISWLMQAVPDNINFAKAEEETLKLWRKLNAFHKQNEIRKDRPRFSFYDGPPFATGLPHFGHILASTIKDTVTRDAVMNNFYVERRFGWDTHGLPVEFEIDKKLGITGPQDVFKMGIKAYNEECRKIVMTYKEVLKNLFNFSKRL